jgi:prophage antirepressor-like protein
MQYALQVFETEKHDEFRTLDIDGEPWFVLADVCKALDLKPNNGSYYRHADRLDEDERRTVPREMVDGGPSPSEGEGAPWGPQNYIIINEAGLYSLTLRSDKPEAKRFKKWITSEVLPSIRKTGSYRGAPKLPNFIKRFNDNWDRVSPGYFSVLNELTVRLYGRFEMLGYVMRDHADDGKELRPDVSVGRTFSEWLKKEHPDRADDYSYYIHTTPQWEGQVRQYPMGLLPLYIEFVETIWIPEYGPAYFKKRDPIALVHLPKLLPMAHKGRPGDMRGLPAPKWGR